MSSPVVFRRAPAVDRDSDSDSDSDSDNNSVPSSSDFDTSNDEARIPVVSRASGPIRPTADYLRRVAVPSRVVAGGKSFLLVLSLDHVLCCTRPRHLSGGYTDVLARAYLTTLMAYVLRPGSEWYFCFYSALTRKKALKVLKSLKLPVGAPDRDERDGSVGLFAKEDLGGGWDTGELETKDLEALWSILDKYEGYRWGPESTLVITDNPKHMLAQPFNFILAPSFNYRSNVRIAEDQFLLMIITCLRDLETETNFTYHIKALKWNQSTFWAVHPSNNQALQDAYVHAALRVCAMERITITAFTGN